MKPAVPTVDFLGCALGDDSWCGVLEQLGCYGEVRVPSSESVMDAAGGVGMSEVEWVVVRVGVVVGNEGRKVGVVVYVEDGGGVV